MPKNKLDPRNPRRARLSLGFVLFLAALALGAESKFTISPYMDYTYSSNIFWNVNQVEDSFIAPGLALNLRANSLNVFLAANGRFYQENDFLNSALLTGGFSLVKIFSSRTSLFFSPEFSLARYDDQVSFLDTNMPGITLGVKHSLSGTLFSRLGLNLRYSDYPNEDSYDRIRAAAFLEMSAFFPSQTTLRLTAGMNYLYFPHIAVLDTADAGLAPGGSQYRRGTPSRPGTPSAAEKVEGITLADLAIPQPYLIVRIAQGLGFKTGISADFLIRRNIDPLQGIQALAAFEWALEQTDDDFFWEGTRLHLGLKAETVLGLEVALDLARANKTYKGIEALDLAGLPVQPQATRSDTLTQASLRISRRIGSTDLYVYAAYRRNDSNDLYFQYDFYTISGGVEFSI